MRKAVIARERFAATEAICRLVKDKTDCFATLAMTLLLMFMVVPIEARPPEIGPVPELKFTPREPERKVLSNGIVAYLIEDHELPLITLSIKMKTTPALEAEQKAGLMGLFGTIWRAGGTTTHTPEKLNELLERMATNIETNSSYETAGISVDTLSKNKSASLALFADILLKPRFDEAQIALSKGKALEAIRRKNDDPGNIGRRAFRDVIYGEDHIYAREADEKSLKNLSRKDLAGLHKTMIVPDGAILVAAGDFKTAELIAELEILLKDWKPSGRKLPTYDYSVKDTRPEEIFFVRKAVSQSRVTMGRVGVARHSPDHFRLTVADYILGGGGASRLFGQIRSRLGLAYAVGSFFSEYEGPGIIAVGAQTKASTTIEIIEATRVELKKFSSVPPSSDELKLAKDALINSFVFNFDSPAEIVAQKADLEFYGYPRNYLETYLDNVRGVSADDVLRVGKTYYLPEQMKVIVIGDPQKFGKSLTEIGKVEEILLEEIR